jgi:hypothetical protein
MGKGKECPVISLKHGKDPDSKFNRKQLAMGIKVEMEHTDCPKVAKQISKAHLREKKNYYTILKKVGL